MRGEHLLHSLFEKSQMRKDNDNRPSTAMNFEISVDIGSVYRQIHHGPLKAEHLNLDLNPLQETESIEQKNKANLPLKKTSDKKAKSTQQPPKVLKFRPNDRNPDQQRVSYTTKEDIDSRGNFRKTLRENILQHKLSDGANDPEDDEMPPISPVDRRESIPFRSKALSLSNGKTYSLAMTTVE